ncbi:MAG: translocation/assembly module TamB domain-containing protein [Marinospirillum sp.]|uniref:translocation/assembly module TamB domain-containing protein n=1 Tax=Marinospirillum sp. TaxID=2183934 RepID=UPI0019F93FDB|nr:translocation/assembly module TamB domain-containing protein [Marinospirillum sp.]MBE0506777.1 translocation/assembly module TamB domain-containing protein [Marinospirillum sp.]
MITQQWLRVRQAAQRFLLYPLMWTHFLLRWLIYLLGTTLSLGSLLLVLLVMWLLFSQPGGQWLLRQLPGVEVSGFQGQLFNRWQTDNLRWSSADGLQLEIQALDVDWHLACLLQKKICIRQLQVDRLNLDLAESAADEESEPFDWQNFRIPDIQLPELRLPLALQVDELQVGAVWINQQLRIEALQAGFDWRDTRLNLQHLSLSSPLLPAGNEAELLLQGWIDLQGNWPLQLQATSQFAGQDFLLDLSGNLDKLQLDYQLSGSPPYPPLQLSGWVQPLQPTLPLELTLQLAYFHPEEMNGWFNHWPQTLQLDATDLLIRGDLQQGWLLQLNSHFRFDQQALQLNLDSHLAGNLLQIQQLLLTHGEQRQLLLQGQAALQEQGRLIFNGQVEGELPLQAELLTLTSDFSGFWDLQQQDYALAVPRLQLVGTDKRLKLELGLTPAFWNLELDLDFHDLSQLAQFSLPEFSLQELQGDLQLKTSLQLPGFTNPFTELMQDQVELITLLRQGAYQLNLDTFGIRMAGFNLQQGSLLLDYDGLTAQDPDVRIQFGASQLQQGTTQLQNLMLHLEGRVSDHQLQLGLTHDGQPLQLQLTGGISEQPEGLEWNYRLEAFLLQQLAELLPEDLRWPGQVSGHWQGQWQEQLTSQLELSAGAGQLEVRLTDSLTLEEEWIPLEYQQLTLSLNLATEVLQARIIVDGDELGYLDASVSLDLHANSTTGQRALQGLYQLHDLQLQLFSPFVDVDELSGRIHGQGEIRGQLLQPQLWGNLQLESVVVADNRWPVSLNRLDGRILLQGQQARLEADFAAGQRGEGKITGAVQWFPELQAELHLQGDGFQLRLEPWAQLEVVPDLRLIYFNQRLKLTGQIAVPTGKISVQQRPQQATGVSEDAHVVGREIQTVTRPNLDMDLDVQLGSQKLELDAFGLKADLRGRLRVGNQMDTRGEVQLLNGTYQSWGQDLRLRRARMNFAGPPELPFLDIEAVRVVDQVVAGLRITGRADQPETEIFSEPAMSSEQALSYLLLGRPLRGETDENAMTSAAVALGLRGVTGVTQRLGDALGVRELQLETEGKGEQTSVMASGYLNERLSVRYGVGLYDEVTRLAVRYDLSRQLYVEAASALASSLDLFWHVDY